MTRRVQQLALTFFATISVASLATAAYFYGASRAAITETLASQAPRHRTLLLGRIVRIEPLHVHIESASLGPLRTYDVLISPQTKFLQLVPWAPGEREKALDDYAARMKKLNPSAGDSIPPPPPQMKPILLDPAALVPDMMVGIGSNEDIDPEKPIIGAVIRPLTSEEARSGQVANTFPL